jgi:hypothetical protein
MSPYALVPTQALTVAHVWQLTGTQAGQTQSPNWRETGSEGRRRSDLEPPPRESVLTRRDFPVLRPREYARQDLEKGPNRRQGPRQKAGIGAVSLYFPGGSGIQAQRRVRTRLHPPPPELPGKIGMSQEHYFTVQQIYLGWSWFGVVVLGALVSDIALAVMLRGDCLASWLAAAGAFAIGATLVIFLIWILPANLATNNWSVAPASWQALRAQWEYGHAVNAVITFAAMASLLFALVLSRRVG